MLFRSRDQPAESETPRSRAAQLRDSHRECVAISTRVSSISADRGPLRAVCSRPCALPFARPSRRRIVSRHPSASDSQDSAVPWTRSRAVGSNQETLTLVPHVTALPSNAMPSKRRLSSNGRYWDRTSDLCRVKVSGGYFARLRDRAARVIGLVQSGFLPLIVSRRFSVILTVMWTRCGRDPGPRVSCIETDRPQPTR